MPVSPLSPSFQVEVFFDGECPLCRREVDALRRWDRKSRLKLTDIADGVFDPASIGVDYGTLMAKIHGRLPSGELIEGVEVFRRVYAAIGLGPVVALTRLPGISWLLDAAYALFAKNRLRLTGRCEADCKVPPPRGGRTVHPERHAVP